MSKLDMTKMWSFDAERVIDILHNMNEEELIDFFNMALAVDNAPSISDTINKIFDCHSLWEKILDEKYAKLLCLKRGVGTVGGRVLSEHSDFMNHSIFYTPEILSERSSQISITDVVTRNSNWVLKFYENGYSLKNPIYVVDR